MLCFPAFIPNANFCRYDFLIFSTWLYPSTPSFSIISVRVTQLNLSQLFSLHCSLDSHTRSTLPAMSAKQVGLVTSSFTAGTTTQLNCAKDTVLTITHSHSSGFYYAMDPHSGGEGWVKKTCVTLGHTFLPTANYEKASEDELSLTSGIKVSAIHAVELQLTWTMTMTMTMTLSLYYDIVTCQCTNKRDSRQCQT